MARLDCCVGIDSIASSWNRLCLAARAVAHALVVVPLTPLLSLSLSLSLPFRCRCAAFFFDQPGQDSAFAHTSLKVQLDSVEQMDLLALTRGKEAPTAAWLQAAKNRLTLFRTPSAPDSTTTKGIRPSQGVYTRDEMKPSQFIEPGLLFTGRETGPAGDETDPLTESLSGKSLRKHHKSPRKYPPVFQFKLPFPGDALDPTPEQMIPEHHKPENRGKSAKGRRESAGSRRPSAMSTRPSSAMSTHSNSSRVSYQPHTKEQGRHGQGPGSAHGALGSASSTGKSGRRIGDRLVIEDILHSGDEDGDER